jgi:osmotically-inducible protein OsmY
MTLANRCIAGVLSTLLAVATVGCAHDNKVGSKFDDTVITSKVKTALLADPDVKGTQVTVETLEGQVQLSGFVDSPAQAQRAVQLAGQVNGVNRVIDKMSVKAK